MDSNIFVSEINSKLEFHFFKWEADNKIFFREKMWSNVYLFKSPCKIELQTLPACRTNAIPFDLEDNYSNSKNWPLFDSDKGFLGN